MARDVAADIRLDPRVEAFLADDEEGRPEGNVASKEALLAEGRLRRSPGRLGGRQSVHGPFRYRGGSSPSARAAPPHREGHLATGWRHPCDLQVIRPDNRRRCRGRLYYIHRRRDRIPVRLRRACFRRSRSSSPPTAYGPCRHGPTPQCSRPVLGAGGGALAGRAERLRLPAWDRMTAMPPASVSPGRVIMTAEQQRNLALAAAEAEAGRRARTVGVRAIGLISSEGRSPSNSPSSTGEHRHLHRVHTDRRRLAMSHRSRHRAQLAGLAVVRGSGRLEDSACRHLRR